MTTRPIAYFSAEYAFNPNLPIYAGGLGILAGDYLREADDQDFPIVGIGLFYDFNNPIKLEQVLEIEVPIQDEKIKVQVFKHMVGSIPVYLLSSPPITHKLYVSDKETRLKQEIILGIGGLRVLEALDIHPIAYHLNEGHSAFLALELIRHEMQEKKVSFEEAIVISRKKIIFTNHTLVAAGREVYSNDLVSLMLAGYSRELGVPVGDVVKLGLVQESSAFSMTMLSLRMSESVNAVSKLHAQKASEIWTDHPMVYVTNGIHIPTWDRSGDDVIAGHQKQKELLLSTFNWDPTTLVLGWARRFVEYKRPLAILEDLDRFSSIARNSNFPIKIIFAGEPHESDDKGHELLQKLLDLIKTKIGDIAAYIPNYDMRIAKDLVAGCDVWLNTPIVGFEACGTSGMKAALNGTLPCSTRDGWIDEAELFKVGWVLDNDRLTQNILDVLQYDIAPMYYKNPNIWQQHMKNARAMVKTQFSTTKMLNDYKERLYKPLGIAWS